MSNWRKRYSKFPKPVGGSPNSPTFDRGEVLRWLKETGKGDQLATAGQTDGGTLRGEPRLEAWGRNLLAGLAWYAPGTFTAVLDYMDTVNGEPVPSRL